MRMCWSPIKVLAGAGVYLSLNIKEADKPHILQLIEYWYLFWMIYLSLKAQLWWYDMILLWLGILGTCLTFWTVFDSRGSDVDIYSITQHDEECELGCSVHLFLVYLLLDILSAARDKDVSLPPRLSITQSAVKNWFDIKSGFLSLGMLFT